MYIGITSQEPEKRWKGGANYSSQPYFYNAIKKYGWDAFEHVIIREGLTEEQAKIAERKLIKHYDSRNRSKGYNITPGGDISPMKDPRVRQKSSLSHKGKTIPEEQRRKVAEILRGRPMREDVKRRVSETVKKLWQDPEYRAHNLAGCKTRSVVAYDKEGNLVFTFSSIKEADESTGIDFRNIQAVCKGRKKTAGGYVWKYADEQANTEVSAETKESA